jgi:hypothetical protein
MNSIEIDFDVFKELTVRRASEDVTYNDVIRDLLGLDPVTETQERTLKPGGCTILGVHFPEGTQFRAVYKGKTHIAEIVMGRWVDDAGTVRNSPSDAARAITGTNINGWRFWLVKRPGELMWRKMDKLR